MRLTIIGGVGAYPEPVAGCSGYVLEHDGFVLLADPGYATVMALQAGWDPGAIGAVVVTHGHPDHCADVNPLLRARRLGAGAVQPPPLPLFCPHGALDAVLALDEPGMLDGASVLHEFEPGATLSIGPFTVRTARLPHFVPSAGLRITAGGATVTYTGDSGPCAALDDLAAGADLLLAEATYADEVPAARLGNLSSARDACAVAARAGVGALWLTHLWPGSDPGAHLAAAESAGWKGPLAVARPGLRIDLPVSGPGPA
ncbi:MBL fold metallo-hydrolase [Dactylosporangium matsuzakiense]|uniref:MBL fold metallo-hydrolase n=1 Tax=Dactylosporangium matsuzakiense TaxID=53360 RepID=A0A9W6NPG6_9ACTN|nr:MBL fold metallo-hydrolase [Dactylosporangium matsuzakiense]UWZ41884.1 MBL fold metallo-hydrolase [Dactylosporangium matsuzakiense]GLL04454.1 MBL fold metallo-hydrolase [Dactylosporangium matsuzakiense]